jgi:hypothetical protein
MFFFCESWIERQETEVQNKGNMNGAFKFICWINQLTGKWSMNS